MKNLQILIGNLGNDPETIHFDNGNEITKFSLATSETWKDKSTGEKKKAVEWHTIITQRHFSNNAKKYLKKGMQVYLEGKTKHRKYEADGITKYITEVHVSDMKFLSKIE